MRFSVLLTITGVVSVVFGLGFFFAPAPVLQQYGVATDSVGLFTAQFYGATLLTLGLVFLLTRGVQDAATIRAIALGACIGNLAGLWVAVRVQMSGQVNPLGWSTVAIYGLLTLGFASFAFGKPRAA